MNEEIISKLIGKLEFRIDTAGLQRFNQLMENAKRSMREVGRVADKLQAQLSKLDGGRATKRGQLDNSIRNSLDREHKLETALASARRAAFTQELKQGKLVYAGRLENAALATAAIRDQQKLAMQLARQQRGSDAKAEASLLRQQRLQELLRTQQARTSKLEADRIRTLTGVQRLELSIANAKAKAQRDAAKFEAVQASRRASERRQQESHAMRQQRFQFAAERHQWAQQRQARIADSGSSFSVSGAVRGLAGIGVALYTLTNVIGKLNERIQQSQTKASDAEQFNNVMDQAGGNNPANVKFVKDEFLRIGKEYGVAVDLPAAQEYRKFILAQTAMGMSLSKAIQVYETQMASFTAAAMTNQQRERANYQLNQIRAKGMPEGADVNDLFDAAPVIAPYIRQAYAKRVGLNLPPDKLAAQFKEDVSDRKVKAADFEQGMQDFLNANRPALEKQKNSIQAEQQRLDNERSLQEMRLYSDKELSAAVRERIQSERDLLEATEGLKESFVGLDTFLNRSKASLYNALSGKKDKPDQDRFGNRNPNIRLNPRLNPGATLERKKREEANSLEPVPLLESDKAKFKPLQKIADGLLQIPSQMSVQGQELLMSGGNKDNPQSVLQQNKNVFNSQENKTVHNNINNNVRFGDINVNVPSGVDANQIPGLIRDNLGDHLDDWFDSVLRRAQIDASENQR